MYLRAGIPGDLHLFYANHGKSEGPTLYLTIDQVKDLSDGLMKCPDATPGIQSASPPNPGFDPINQVSNLTFENPDPSHCFQVWFSCCLTCASKVLQPTPTACHWSTCTHHSIHDDCAASSSGSSRQGPALPVT